MKNVIIMIIALTVIIISVVTYFVVSNKAPTSAFNIGPGYIFDKHTGYKNLYSSTVDECEKICDAEPECAAFQFQIPTVSDKITACSLFKSVFTTENINKTDLPGYIVGINSKVSKEFFNKTRSTSKM